MRERVLALAKGNFIYESPELVITPKQLMFDVAAGEKKNVRVTVENKRGSVMKGFGATDDPKVNFLPVFHSEKNELTMEFDATGLVAGTTRKGQLYLVTDCGEAVIPFEAKIVATVLEDKDTSTIIKDYSNLRQRIEVNPESAAALFHSPAFSDVFLYRDEAGKVLYRHLVKKNSKMQSMEEFLVAMGKKDPIRLNVRHPASGSAKEIHYELQGTDITDTLRIRVNTWGCIGVHIEATADFIEPEIAAIRTSDFENNQYILSFTILAERVRGSKKKGSIIVSTLYEKKEIQIYACDLTGAEERGKRRREKALVSSLFRLALDFAEQKIEKEDFLRGLKERKSALNIVGKGYELPIAGYLNGLRGDEERILNFYREAERLEEPEDGADSREVESYILVQYIKYFLNKREEDREEVVRLLAYYEEKGYNGLIFFVLHLKVSERYRTWKWKEEDIRRQIEQGNNSPVLYSELVRVYQNDVTLVTSLDVPVMMAMKYGLRHDLITKDMAMAVSVLTRRTMVWNPMMFSLLEQLYDKFELEDTLRSICGMLIRNDKRENRYFKWFDLGVKKRLRMTELYEYYMYTINYHATFRLPDNVLSYFQYENHLNDRCKAFLYAYIIRKKADWPDVYEMYADSILAFTMRQLTHHRVTEDICVLYEELFMGSTQEESDLPIQQMAKDLSEVMFDHLLTCEDDQIDSVVVVHAQTKTEILYPLENGRTIIQIYTPDYQLYFVNREGHYLAGTVEYTLKKMLQLDTLAQWCLENGADSAELLVHLTAKALRGIRLNGEQAALMYRVMELGYLRENVQGKLIYRLYEYYYEQKEMGRLLELLERISPQYCKEDKVGKIAEDCIYQGLYEKAYRILSHYGTEGCDKKALSVLTIHQIEKSEGEFSPLLVKWSYDLYKEKIYDHKIMDYLLQYYMGRTSVLTTIYQKSVESGHDKIADGSKERVLGQALFAGAEPSEYDDLLLDYYENGTNRMLVKAFLAYYAYEYLVSRVEDLPEDIFVHIEKEAFYSKERIMVLATLKKYSKESNYAKKQLEFVEKNLEECAVDGIILDFMKDFVGKASVPYEIESFGLIQYYSGTDKEIFLHVLESGGKENVVPMSKVFDGIYIQQMVLFSGEEKTYYIEEEESGFCTEKRTMRQPQKKQVSDGLFHMINEMVELQQEYEKTQNENLLARYNELGRKYEKNRAVAEKLFTIEG